MTKNALYSKHTTILLAIFYILGLIAAFYNHEIILSICAFLLLIFFIFNYNFGFKKTILLYLIFLLGLFRTNFSYNFKSNIDYTYLNDVTLKGQVVSTKNILKDNNKVKFYLKTNSILYQNKEYNDINAKILINADTNNESLENIKIGNYIEIKGNLRPPKNSTNPHQFDYKKYLLNNDCKNILYSNTKEINVIKKASFLSNLNDSWYFILNKFETKREEIIQKHGKNIKSPKLEILGGIVFGNEAINPDEKIKESFKNSGLLHLLAASGLNVALIYGIWWWLASLMRFPYQLSIFLGGGFVIVYTFMTGFPPSILRASIMLLFVLFGKIIDREADSIALVFFAGFLILLFNPKMFFDVGFQLSFMVTIGLIICCPILISKFDNLNKKFEEKHKNDSRIKKYFVFLFSPKTMASIILVPLVAQIWVIPLQMHYFNNLAPLSVLANIAVVPFIGILSFIGFISSIIALIPNLNEPIVYFFDLLANPMLSLLLNISDFFASFKNSLLNVQGLNVFQIFIFWGIVLFITYNIKNNFKNKKELLCLILFSIIFIFSFIKIDSLNKNLEISMFDVGNADSFLIKTPNKKYILIDTGKKPYKSTSSGNTIINKYLKNEHIKKIDILILTHFDTDHCGGSVDILKNTKTDKIIIQKEQTKTILAKEVLDYLKKENLNYSIAENNKEIYSEKDLKIITFSSNFNSIQDIDKKDNEESIITLIKFKDKNILFMGDSGILGYEKIKNYLPQKIDILKIGHHGAQYSIDKNMIKKLNPTYALISTGYNKFNHPHYSTINLLEEEKIKTISTKNYGFTKIVINKDISILNYDNIKNKLKKTLFDKKEEIPFHKTKFMENFEKEYL